MSRYTTKHPARNAIAALLLISMAQALSDFVAWMLP
jgi:hypothetical protein